MGWMAVVALAVGHVGGDFWAGNFAFGCSGVNYTHLGCFGAPGEARASAKSFDNAFQESGLPN
jgi:hypothetical protein